MRQSVDWNFFCEGMEYLGVLYEQQVDEERKRAYWRVLRSLSREEYTFGIGLCADECKFFPRPADITARGRTFYERQGDAARKAAEDQERAAREAEFRAWKADPSKFARDRVRIRLLGEHAAGDHRRPVAECGSCEFERVHRKPHLHLRDDLTAADIDWTQRNIVGCCAREVAA